MKKPAKKKTEVETKTIEPVKLDFDYLDREISRLLGFHIEHRRSQKEYDYAYGYAQVCFTLGGSGVVALRGRVEGDGSGCFVGKYPLECVNLEKRTQTGVAEWVANVLKTGRTIECGKGIGVRNLGMRIRSSSLAYPLESVIEMIDEKADHSRSLDLNPDYQRGDVWTLRQAEQFVGHYLEGGDIPKIYVQRYDSEETAPKGTKWHELPMYVLDGQQRLRSLYRWVKGEIEAEISDGRRFKFADTNEVDRRCMMLNLDIVDLSRADQLRFYIKLNRGGTIHTDKEIDHVWALLAKEEQKSA